jgi:hypothetical protein
MDERPCIPPVLQGVLRLQEQLAKMERLGRPELLRPVQEFDRLHKIAGTMPLAGERTPIAAYLKAFEAAQAFKLPHGFAQIASDLANARGPHHELLSSIAGPELPVHLRSIGIGGELFRSVGVNSQLEAWRDSWVFRHAENGAALAANIGLPKGLEHYRLSTGALADRLAIGAAFHEADVAKWSEPSYMAQFSAAAAAAEAFSRTGAFDTAIRESLYGLQLLDVPESFTLSGYRSLLDTAGLTLPRWPQLWIPKVRRVTVKERAARQQARLSLLRQPPHVGKAKSLVHQHEYYLQQVIDEAMASEYGEDWPNERLPLCGQEGRQLLSRWKKRGGHPLEHADYPHYTAVMAHPDHHGTIFCLCFPDPSDIEDLIERARQLRAASHHPGHSFTPNDLRDLRTTWRALKKGLSALDGPIFVTMEF